MDENIGAEMPIDDEAVKPKASIPLATLRRIMKKHGVSMMSQDAVEELQRILDDILLDMSRNIIVATKHRSAKKTTRADILLAIR